MHIAKKCKTHIYEYIWSMVNYVDGKLIIKDEVNQKHSKIIIVWFIIIYNLYQSEMVYT